MHRGQELTVNFWWSSLYTCVFFFSVSLPFIQRFWGNQNQQGRNSKNMDWRQLGKCKSKKWKLDHALHSTKAWEPNNPEWRRGSLNCKPNSTLWSTSRNECIPISELRLWFQTMGPRALWPTRKYTAEETHPELLLFNSGDSVSSTALITSFVFFLLP